MPALGLGRGLARLGKVFLSYILSDRSVDLGDLEAQTAPDLSGNSNDATLTSNVYFSTNGTTGKAIQADCSAAGVGNYYLTGYIRPDGTTAVLNLNGSPDTLTGLTDATWQTFQSATKTGITPDQVVVGWNGASSYSAADWSDVRLIDADTSETVAHWQGIDSEDTSLEGYPVLDSSGNGYHGTHSAGVAGGGGETGALQTMGVDFNKRMWFDGVNDYVDLGTFNIVGDATTDSAFSISAKCLINDVGKFVILSGSSVFIDSPLFGTDASGQITFGLYDSGVESRILVFQNATAPLNQEFWLTATYDGSSTSAGLKIYLDGVELSLSANDVGSYVAIDGDSQTWSTGARWLGSVAAAYSKGYVSDLHIHSKELSGAEVSTIHNGGTVASSEVSRYKINNANAVIDLVGSNNGTVNGAPSQYYSAAQSTTLDALGNALDFTRPNARVLNGAVPSSYATVADDASRDSTNVFGAWVYHDGTDGVIADYSDGAGTVKIENEGAAVYPTGLTGQSLWTGTKTTEMGENSGYYYSGGAFKKSTSNAVQTGDFTFEATYVYKTDTGTRGIAGAGWLSPSTGLGFAVDDISNFLSCQVRNGGNIAKVTSSFEAVDGVAYRLKMTWVESTHTVEFYINDALIGSDTNALVTRSSNPDDVWSIGARSDGGTEQFFTDGLIYNVLLDGVDILTLDTFSDTGSPQPAAQLTEGWNYVFATFADFNPTAATRYYGRQGNIIEYTETKTLAEAERNRKATKGQY